MRNTNIRMAGSIYMYDCMYVWIRSLERDECKWRRSGLFGEPWGRQGRLWPDMMMMMFVCKFIVVFSCLILIIVINYTFRFVKKKFIAIVLHVR